uniref:Hemoglobin n=1 Tax=Anadara broughtonii TaxID=148819 RepID=A0A3G3IRD7_ANABR|nr:hemoglobin [Anadara broughtonii]
MGVADAIKKVDAKQITSTWAILESDKPGNGVELMLQLFKDDATAKGKFGRLGDPANKDEALKNSKFVGQSAMLMGGLQVLVENLGNPLVLEACARNLAVKHIARNMTAEDFGRICGSLDKILDAKNAGADAKAAWRNLVAVVQEAMRE